MNKSRLLRLSKSPLIVRSSATRSLLARYPARQFTTVPSPYPADTTTSNDHSRINQSLSMQQPCRGSIDDHKQPLRASRMPEMTSTNLTVVIDSVYELKTSTWQYIVVDPDTLKAVIIDPVLDFDSTTHSISTATADSLLNLITSKAYRIQRTLETHVHADHVTAASYLQSTLERVKGFKPSICIGKRIRGVQRMFGERYGVRDDEMDSAFDCLLDDDEIFLVGNLQVRVMHLPGHTPDHIGYRIADNVFCGNSLFNADLGTARCDFPGGSAGALYQSTRKLLSLPEDYKIWTGHDYPSPDREELMPWMSVREQKLRNRYLRDNVSEQVFRDMRSERDAVLSEPKLLHASLQVNIRGGRLPSPSSKGERFLRTPIRGVLW